MATQHIFYTFPFFSPLLSRNDFNKLLLSTFIKRASNGDWIVEWKFHKLATGGEVEKFFSLKCIKFPTEHHESSNNICWWHSVCTNSYVNIEDHEGLHSFQYFWNVYQITFAHFSMNLYIFSRGIFGNFKNLTD